MRLWLELMGPRSMLRLGLGLAAWLLLEIRWLVVWVEEGA